MRRASQSARAVDLKPLVSALVRQAISRGDENEALEWIERARPMADAETAATFDVWRAEILARLRSRRTPRSRSTRARSALTERVRQWHLTAR